MTRTGSSRFSQRATLLLVLAMMSAPISAAGAAASTRDDGQILPPVSTIAGSGSLGVSNGVASQASFMEPSGVAVAADGSIFVSDAAAQTIRRIKNGVVEPYAGVAAAGRTAGARAGGDVDGPVATSRFDRPMGLAVAKDGSLYVADLMNHCIRRIRNGMVTTVPGTSALQTPLAVAVDDDNNLYVADFAGGLRKLTPDGTLSTIPQPPPPAGVYASLEPAPKPEDGDVFGVSARGAGANLELAWTTATATYLRARGRTVRAGARLDREPTGEGLQIGTGGAVVIAGDNSVVVSDVVTNAVRFIQFDTLPLDVATMTRTLAGGIREGDAMMGGFRDGPSDVALVDVPLGLARAPDGAVIVADAGNRRIRRIGAFDTRGPVLPDLSNLTGPRNAYRIAIVGNSFTFNNVLWDESIAGIVEAGLKRDGTALGLDRPVFVSAARLDASTITTQRNFIDSYLGDGEADLVILLVNAFNHNTELSARPDLAVANKWKTVIPMELHDLAAHLASSQTKMLVPIFPEGQFVSTVEVAGRDQYDSAFAITDDQIAGRLDDMLELERVYATSGIRTVPLVEPMLAAENGPGREQFFNSRDIHLTRRGASFIGKNVLQAIEVWKPWAR